MEVDRREKSVEQSTNAILYPSAGSESTFFLNCPVLEILQVWLAIYKLGINAVHLHDSNKAWGEVMQLGQLIMYYTPKKVLPFAFF